MWTGLLHHVTGEHSWALGACHHGPLLKSREKEWIQQGSVAHQRLTDIILEARWLKNVHKYLRFRRNSTPESNAAAEAGGWIVERDDLSLLAQPFSF
ncbi:hypothetical protein KUCAC02_028057 [Chaenocephalus aceratus]|uniref:Uncharacterized protein n=1 Tax=Chaenocephalus aceratus TaxID=36190 RepID=A0ACB9X0R2_CHAAC|nr:hypothetical protein KUCAC02_028057 [Chaenocephalus aceratus]